jgi:diketogulonate reductase-like aldo/keto reductase
MNNVKHIDNHKDDLYEELNKHITDSAIYVKQLLDNSNNLQNNVIVNNVMRSYKKEKAPIMLEWVLTKSIKTLSKDKVRTLCM